MTPEVQGINLLGYIWIELKDYSGNWLNVSGTWKSTKNSQHWLLIRLEAWRKSREGM